MLKKTVKYYDFNGDEANETLYFNLTTTEVAKLAAEFGGDIEKYIKKITAAEDMNAMLTFIEKLILASYGVKSEDGKRFMKTAALREEFESSAVYAELFEQLLMNPEEAKAFGEGLAHGARKK